MTPLDWMGYFVLLYLGLGVIHFVLIDYENGWTIDFTLFSLLVTMVAWPLFFLGRDS